MSYLPLFPVSKVSGTSSFYSTDSEGAGVEEEGETLASESKDKDAKKRKATDSENVQPNAEVSQGTVAERKIKNGI